VLPAIAERWSIAGETDVPVAGQDAADLRDPA
jgi:hypothetical protein